DDELSIMSSRSIFVTFDVRTDKTAGPGIDAPPAPAPPVLVVPPVPPFPPEAMVAPPAPLAPPVPPVALVLDFPPHAAAAIHAAAARTCAQLRLPCNMVAPAP